MYSLNFYEHKFIIEQIIAFKRNIKSWLFTFTSYSSFMEIMLLNIVNKTRGDHTDFDLVLFST